MAKTKNLFEELAKGITPSQQNTQLVTAVQREAAEIPGWTKSTWGKSSRCRPEVTPTDEQQNDSSLSLSA